MSFFEPSPQLEDLRDRLLDQALAAFGAHGLERERFAFIVMLGQGAERPAIGAAHRPGWRCYPCSLVKVFHLVACHARLADGTLQRHEDLELALRDMILWSSNTATNYIIDLVTGTTGDTLLPPDEMRAWEDRRRWLNRHFASFGWQEFDGVNLCQKLMDDQRYGRERHFVKENGENHNALTPSAMARLMWAIFRDDIGSPIVSEKLKNYLERSLDSPERARSAYQIDGYLAAGLPKGSAVWSKAGHTCWTGDATASFFRHDTIRALLPGGKELFMTVFTQGEKISENTDFMPWITATTCALLDAGSQSA